MVMIVVPSIKLEVLRSRAGFYKVIHVRNYRYRTVTVTVRTVTVQS